MNLRVPLTLALGVVLTAYGSSDPQYPTVTAPPGSFFQIVAERDREVARAFYKEHIDVEGMPVHLHSNRHTYFASKGVDFLARASPADAPHPIGTREALKDHEPNLYALVDETMAYRGHPDWRFKP
jgi:hypothetical protein